MTRIAWIRAMGIAASCVALMQVVPPTAAQQRPLKDQLVGTWSFVSSTSQRDDGSNTWGPGAKGQLIFTDGGRFSFYEI